MVSGFKVKTPKGNSAKQDTADILKSEGKCQRADFVHFDQMGN